MLNVLTQDKKRICRINDFYELQGFIYAELPKENLILARYDSTERATKVIENMAQVIENSYSPEMASIIFRMPEK